MSNTDFEEQPDGGQVDGEVIDEVEGEEPEGGTEDEASDEVVASGDEEGGEEEVEERRPSRAEARIRTLREEAQREREERQRVTERFERELSELRQAHQSRSESPEAEAERLALMEPEARAQYKLDKAIAEMKRDQALTQFKMEDQSDKMAFQAKAQADKVYAKYAEKVEAERVRVMREQGTAIPREDLLKWMVGADALVARGKMAAREATRGQRNVQRQTTRPVNGRADTRGERRGSADTPAKRLDGVFI